MTDSARNDVQIDLFSKLPIDLLMSEDFAHADLVVAAFMYYKAGSRGYFYGSQERMSQMIGCDRRTLQRAIRKLIDQGYFFIRQERQDKPYSYHVMARGLTEEQAKSHPWNQKWDLDPAVSSPQGVAVSSPPPSINSKETGSKDTIYPGTSPEARVFLHYQERIQPAARTPGYEQIRRRLKTFTVDELMQAIDHFKADEWHMEHNAARGAPWFFANDQRIENYLNMKPRSGTISRAAQNQSGRGSTHHMDFRAQDFSIEEGYMAQIEERLAEGKQP